MTYYPGELEALENKWRGYINCSGHDPEQKVLVIEIDRLRSNLAAEVDARRKAEDALQSLWNNLWAHVLPGTELELKVRAVLAQIKNRKAGEEANL